MSSCRGAGGGTEGVSLHGPRTRTTLALGSDTAVRAALQEFPVAPAELLHTDPSVTAKLCCDSRVAGRGTVALSH